LNNQKPKPQMTELETQKLELDTLTSAWSEEVKNILRKRYGDEEKLSDLEFLILRIFVTAQVRILESQEKEKAEDLPTNGQILSDFKPTLSDVTLFAVTEAKFQFIDFMTGEDNNTPNSRALRITLVTDKGIHVVRCHCKDTELKMTGLGKKTISLAEENMEEE